MGPSSKTTRQELSRPTSTGNGSFVGHMGVCVNLLPSYPEMVCHHWNTVSKHDSGILAHPLLWWRHGQRCRIVGRLDECANTVTSMFLT